MSGTLVCASAKTVEPVFCTRSDLGWWCLFGRLWRFRTRRTIWKERSDQPTPWTTAALCKPFNRLLVCGVFERSGWVDGPLAVNCSGCFLTRVSPNLSRLSCQSRAMVDYWMTWIVGQPPYVVREQVFIFRRNHLTSACPLRSVRSYFIFLAHLLIQRDSFKFLRRKKSQKKCLSNEVFGWEIAFERHFFCDFFLRKNLNESRCTQTPKKMYFCVCKKYFKQQTNRTPLGLTVYQIPGSPRARSTKRPRSRANR